ncbi:hypothetical protein AMURIS_03495 [Acetatifactor muris]|uniref:Uncharacterized protein n=1 Tax=Acetatifactor muris TaxID=879566 RepID=A0A2K4ZJU9_9FIRM|nr:hypothetical protein AMURIS_03495 [Acetatifactor muris]
MTVWPGCQIMKQKRVRNLRICLGKSKFNEMRRMKEISGVRQEMRVMES